MGKLRIAMRKSTACPWCKSEMVERLRTDEDASPYTADYFSYCFTCDARGPRYYYVKGKKIYNHKQILKNENN